MTDKATKPFYLANRPLSTRETLDVKNKFSQETFASVCLAGPEDYEAALEAGVNAFDTLREMAPYERKAILLHCAYRLRERREEFARVIAQEVGKALVHARTEVDRACDTFTLAAEEATRIRGETESLEISAAGKGLRAITQLFPVGLCGFIIPFNFPLNLAAHKIAPALAVGNPFIAKPASATPVSLLMLGDILAETSLPQGSFSILPAKSETAQVLARDARVQHLSFTGSSDVGWKLKTLAGKKPVTLELGGNAACIVDAGADVRIAAKRLAYGAFYQAGQSCISVQQVFAHDSLYAELKAALISETAKLKCGDPLHENTFLGPLISEAEAIRVEEWIKQAVSLGADIVCGGKRQGAFVEATWLEKVPKTALLACEEAFGPVATLSPFTDFRSTVAAINESRFGLQLGVFTPLLEAAHYAYHHAQVGGVVVNDIPSVRIDSMAYGGMKDSGCGREGVRFAMREMMTLKTLVMRQG